jgi:hypothetical protein
VLRGLSRRPVGRDSGNLVRNVLLGTGAPSGLIQVPSTERLDVLRDCHICFSHRLGFKDDHELQPRHATFGTEEEIESFVHSGKERWSGNVPSAEIIRMSASNPHYQATAVKTMTAHMRSPDEFGVLCLTEEPHSEQMARELEFQQQRLGEAMDQALDQVIDDDVLRRIFTACHKSYGCGDHLIEGRLDDATKPAQKSHSIFGTIKNGTKTGPHQYAHGSGNKPVGDDHNRDGLGSLH